MKNTINPFKKAVQLFYENKSLSDSQQNQLQSLQEQARTDVNALVGTESANEIESGICHKIRNKWLIPVSIAASMSAIFVLVSLLSVPHLVSHAYTDVLKDASDYTLGELGATNRIQLDMVKAVPEKYSIEMHKYCFLDKEKTMHLRVAGVEQGKLHLFFKKGKGETNWLTRTGNYKDMHWKILQLKDDLTLLVMYTQDMRESSVNHIVNEVVSVVG